jgi:hypothetical protein
VLDLKKSANLRVSPGSVTALAWTSDGYGLAVGYEKGWAVWSMGGRLGGWGLEGEDEASTEGFMQGVTDLVSRPWRSTLRCAELDSFGHRATLSYSSWHGTRLLIQKNGSIPSHSPKARRQDSIHPCVSSVAMKLTTG